MVSSQRGKTVDVIGRKLALVLVTHAPPLRWSSTEVERDIPGGVARVRVIAQSVCLECQRVRKDHKTTSPARWLVAWVVLGTVVLIARRNKGVSSARCGQIC